VSAVKYLFDQDFNGRIVRGVRRRAPGLDTLTVQEARLKAESGMAGLILIRQSVLIREAIDDLVLIGETTTAEEWRGIIIFLPL
jgi:hypothetical protein